MAGNNPMPGELVPLARALSKLGYCSRAQATLHIKNGKVSVNGRTTIFPLSPVDIDKDVIEIDKQRLSKPDAILIMLHKPRGFVTTSSDELLRKTVYELVPNNMHLFAVGRLDLDSTGLLLFTNDGVLQNKILSPDSHIVKTYLVSVNGKISQDQVKKLGKGVEIEEGVIAIADECEIVETSPSNTKLKIKIHEGKNREIRRMFDAIGKKVAGIHRTAIGKLELDVAEGSWRQLSNDEIEMLFG
jgi:23S rRNA pseudouridine2605 synthase